MNSLPLVVFLLLIAQVGFAGENMNNEIKHSCGRVMENIGNVDGIVYTTNPPMWNETLVCHHCKVRTKIHVRGEALPSFDYREYREVSKPSGAAKS